MQTEELLSQASQGQEEASQEPSRRHAGSALDTGYHERCAA